MKAVDFDLMKAAAKVQAQRAQLEIAASKGGHMKVKILRAGKYSDFSTPPRVRSQKLVVGDEVEFPTGYADGLIEKGYAEPVAEKAPEAEELVAESKGAERESAELDATLGATKLAEEKGLDLRYIAGTGRDGRITAKDVREAMSGASA